MSAEVKATSNVIPCAFNRRPASFASSTPRGVKSTSRHPVNRFFRFHSLWPWRNRTRRRSTAGMRFHLVGDSTGDCTSTGNRRRQPKKRLRLFRRELSVSARRESGFERNQSRPGDRPDADRTIDPLGRLDDVDAGKGESKRGANPLDRRRGADHEGPGDRWRIKRLAPEDGRELRAVKQIAQLRFRIGQALSIWRAIGARPDAPTRGNDHNNSPLWRSDTP